MLSSSTSILILLRRLFFHLSILDLVPFLNSIPGRLETWPVASSADSKGKYFKILPFRRTSLSLEPQFANLQSFHQTHVPPSPFSRIPSSPSPSDIQLSLLLLLLSHGGLAPLHRYSLCDFLSSRLCSLHIWAPNGFLFWPWASLTGHPVQQVPDHWTPAPASQDVARHRQQLTPLSKLPHASATSRRTQLLAGT